MLLVSPGPRNSPVTFSSAFFRWVILLFLMSLMSKRMKPCSLGSLPKSSALPLSLRIVTQAKIGS